MCFAPGRPCPPHGPSSLRPPHHDTPRSIHNRQRVYRIKLREITESPKLSTSSSNNSAHEKILNQRFRVPTNRHLEESPSQNHIIAARPATTNNQTLPLRSTQRTATPPQRRHDTSNPTHPISPSSNVFGTERIWNKTILRIETPTAGNNLRSTHRLTQLARAFVRCPQVGKSSPRGGGSGLQGLPSVLPSHRMLPTISEPHRSSPFR